MKTPVGHDYSTVVAALCKDLLAEEGEILWLYLDTAGIVTAGRGHAIRTAAACAALPWRARYSADELRAAWEAVHAAIPADAGSLLHRGARHYEPLTHVRMTPTESIDIHLSDICEIIPHIISALPSYPTYPAGPQQAILDLCFNVGVHGFVHGFPHCFERVKSCDWAGAALCCQRRPPISEARNKRTAALFHTPN